VTTAITGACGEHYVASYLSGYGLIVALPRAGVKGSDLFVAEDDGHPLRVQVKTGKQSYGSDRTGQFYSWDTSYTVINQLDPSQWFAYLWLNGWPKEPNLPELFFVPSEIVVDHMKTQQAANNKRPFFWMYVGEAENYRGANGLILLRSAMKPKTA